MATAFLPPSTPENDDIAEIDRVVELIDSLRQPAFNLAYRLVRRPEDAADVVQDAFILAVRAARGTTAAPREPAHFKAWLLKIVTNTALAHLRRKRPVPNVSLDDLEGDLADSRAEQPLTAVIKREQRGDVLQALLALPDAQRAALTLREYQGLTYDEIGDMLGMNRGSTTALLYRARHAFRAAYEGVTASKRKVGCVKLAPMISAMLDGELEGSDWKRVDHHVSTCHRCTRELRLLRRGQDLHSIIPLLAPPTAWTTAARLGELGMPGTAEIVNLASRAPAAANLADRVADVSRPLAAGALLGVTALFPAGIPANVASLAERGLGKLAAAVAAAGLLLVVAASDPAPSHDPVNGASDGNGGSVAASAGPGRPGDALAYQGLDTLAGSNAAPSQADRDEAAPIVPVAPLMLGTAAAPAPAAGQTAPHVADQRAQPEAVAESRIPAVQDAPVAAQPDPATVVDATNPAAGGVSTDSAPPAGAPGSDPAGSPAAGGTSGGGTSSPGAGGGGTTGDPTGQSSPPDAPGIDVPPIDPPAIDVPPLDLGVVAVDLPAVDLPEIGLPTIAEGELTVPPVDLPAVDVPAITVPPVNLGVAGLPPINVPAIDVPPIDVPAIAVPPVEVPLADLPVVEGTLDRAQGVVGQAVTGVNQTTGSLSTLGTQVQNGLVDGSTKSLGLNAGTSVGGSGPSAAPLDVSVTSGAGAPAAGIQPAAEGGTGVSVTVGGPGNGQGGSGGVDVGVNAGNGGTPGQPNPTSAASVQGTVDGNGADASVSVGGGAVNAEVGVDGGGADAAASAGGVNLSATIDTSPDGSGSSSGSGGSGVSISATIDASPDGSGSSDSSGGSGLSVTVDTSESSGSSDSGGSGSSGGGLSVTVDTNSGSSGSSDNGGNSGGGLSVTVDTSSSSGSSDNGGNSGGGSLNVTVDTSSSSGSSDNGGNSGGGGGGVGVSVGGISVSVP